MGRKRVLISTITPSPGGVNTMTAFVVQALVKSGLEPVIAHYQPYSQSPELSVPSFRLFTRSTGSMQALAFNDCETHAIGAWLPELEFPHYFATRQWKALMNSCEAFISVSGNVLAATPFLQTRRPYVAWVATDWEGDRRDRIRAFSAPRKLLDQIVNGPVIRRLERKLLRSGTILALSHYTGRALQQIARTPCVQAVLPMPVDGALFCPKANARVQGRIGFSGRFDDPRKNINLLLDALATLKQRGQSCSAVLIGGVPTDEMVAIIERHQLRGAIELVPHVTPAELAAWLQTLDVFVLPSHQEGLCIAALEAMACGVPVVSTRCGGPEEFVIPGQTGSLVDFDAAAMADAIAAIIGDADLRQTLAAGAREITQSKYTQLNAESVLTSALQLTFPHLQFNQPTLPSCVRS